MYGMRDTPGTAGRAQDETDERHRPAQRVATATSAGSRKPSNTAQPPSEKVMGQIHAERALLDGTATMLDKVN